MPIVQLSKSTLFCFKDDEEDSYIQDEAIESLHKLVPQKVNVDFENTNITLSMHSQKR